MIYQNVPQPLFEALRRSGCIMYIDDGIVESISLDRVLAVYNDRIIVYNYDKALRVHCPATNLLMFRVQYIDQFYHVFTTRPYPILEEFIKKVENNDMEALMFGDDAACEAISMALRALEMPPLRYPKPTLFSSFVELPGSIQETMMNKIDDGENVGLVNPYNPEAGKAAIAENVVLHTVPMEELQADFDPWNLTDRGRELLGITPDNPPFIEKTIQDDEINAACTGEDFKQIRESGGQIRAAGLPARIGTNIYQPALIKVVDEVEPPMPEPPPTPVRIAISVPENPIGYIEAAKKQSKKK